MPFKSEKQRRWMRKNKPEMAEEWEREEEQERKRKKAKRPNKSRR